MSTMGERVAALREEAGLKQTELARRIGIRQPSLSSIESNQTKRIAGETLAGLCRELRTTAKYILDGAGPAHPPQVEIAEMSAASKAFLRYFNDLTPEEQQKIAEVAKVITGRAVPDHEVEEKMPVTKRRRTEKN